MEIYKYAYLVGALAFGLCWLLLFILRKDLRREMVVMSALISLLGLTEPLFFGEYWSPQFIVNIFDINLGIESIALMFFQGGISAVIFELIFKQKISRYHYRKNHSPRTFIGVVTLGFLIGGLIKYLYGLNIIYVGIVGMVISGILYLLLRPDLIKNTLLSGMLFGLISLLILIVFGILYPGIFEYWWNAANLSGINILGVPIEELLWHTGVGITVGPFYEIFTGFKNSKYLSI